MFDEQPVIRHVCPGCEPDVDITREIVEVWHCDTHAPDQRGVEDSTIIRPTETLSGAAEAGGEGNRAWCDFFHRKKVQAG